MPHAECDTAYLQCEARGFRRELRQKKENSGAVREMEMKIETEAETSRIEGGGGRRVW